jgi:hypothetical protein
MVVFQLADGDIWWAIWRFYQTTTGLISNMNKKNGYASHAGYLVLRMDICSTFYQNRNNFERRGYIRSSASQV